MARRSTDLLEVFRGPRETGASASSSASGRKPKKRSKKSGAKRSGLDGLVLGPRQVLLASCVMVLMLVLAFTVGLGVGRRGAPGNGQDALSRPADTGHTAAVWYIQGRVPRRSVMYGEEVDPDLLKEDLVAQHGFRASDLRVTEGERGYFFVHYGPFTSKDQARKVLRENNLGYLKVQGTYPFSLEEIVRVER